MSFLPIDRLLSGGLITNYNCTSKCRHCLYNCSPSRPKDYIDPSLARTLFETASRLGVSSMHIGGGEPFLNIEKVAGVLDAAAKAGVSIDYIETNSSWYTNEQDACDRLLSLKSHGLSTLLISISPFHAEYIPLYKVKGVMKACERTGINVFPWMGTFLDDLSGFDPLKTIGWGVMMKSHGRNYLADRLNRYWIHPGGRAIQTFKPVYPEKTLDQVLKESSATCRGQLSDTSHFHMDLYGNYIPGLCAGLSIAADDLEKGISADRYPILRLLVEEGISGLFEFAVKKKKYKAGKTGFMNQCELCNDIRTFLIKTGGFGRELAPAGYYGGQ